MAHPGLSQECPQGAWMAVNGARAVVASYGRKLLKEILVKILNPIFQRKRLYNWRLGS